MKISLNNISLLKDYKNGKNFFAIKVLFQISNNNGLYKYKIEDKSMSLNTISNIYLEENNVYLIETEYLEKYKILKINKVFPIKDKTIIEKFININSNKFNKEYIKEYISTIYLNDKFYKKIFNTFILKKIDKLLNLSATKFYTYNYEGGLLTRNLEILENSLNLMKIKNIKNIDKDLIIISSLLLDISKLNILKEDGSYNKIGQLLPTNIILIQQLQNTYQLLKQGYLKEIKFLNLKKENENNFLDKLNIELNELLHEKITLRKYLETLKFNKETNLKYKSILDKKRKTQEDKEFLKNNEEKIQKWKENLLKYKKIIKNIKRIRKNINKYTKKIKTLEYKTKKLKQLISNNSIKLAKLEHILLSYKYYITNKEEEFPRFIEAQIVSHSYQQIVNLEMFLQEYNKISNINTNYSNKLNKYLFKE